jgi:hypothetical protein
VTKLLSSEAVRAARLRGRGAALLRRAADPRFLAPA